MKKYCILALVLVLTATLFAGCRRRNDMDVTTLPMTEPTTMPATQAPTQMPTVPTTEGMIGTEDTEIPTGVTGATGETGTATDTTDGTGSTEGQSRRAPATN